MQQAITLLGVFQMLLPFLPLQNGVHFDVPLRCALKTHPTFTAKLLEKNKKHFV